MYSFLAYAPHETEEQRRATYDLIDWIVDTDPLARVSLYRFAPYPGSPLFDDAVAGRGTGYGCEQFKPPSDHGGMGPAQAHGVPYLLDSRVVLSGPTTLGPTSTGTDYKLIEPYVELAKKKWAARDPRTSPAKKWSG